MDPDREESIRRYHRQHEGHECEGCEILAAWAEERQTLQSRLVVEKAKRTGIVTAMAEFLGAEPDAELLG